MATVEETIREMVNAIVDERLRSQPSAPRPLLNAEQVGELLGIDKQSVYRLHRENALKAVQMSETRFRFHPDEVERFIREGGVKPCRLSEAPRKVLRGGQR